MSTNWDQLGKVGWEVGNQWSSPGLSKGKPSLMITWIIRLLLSPVVLRMIHVIGNEGTGGEGGELSSDLSCGQGEQRNWE